MKNLVKIGLFTLFLLGFGVISPNVHAESGDTYTVNFVTNGGGNVDPQVVNSGDTLDVSLISVHKDGHSFSGWYTETGFVNEFNINTDSVMSDLTLYAKWRQHKINVRYHPEGGRDVRTKENPALDPLRYSKNSCDSSGKGVQGGAAVCELFYTKSDWNITTAGPDYTSSGAAWWLAKRGYVGHVWRLVGGTGEDAQKLSTTKRFSQNRKIAQELGMLDEFNAGDISLELYADWTLANYTLTYTGLDDDCVFGNGENPDTYTMLSGDITLNNPSKTGYTFLGRSGTDIEGLSTGVVITGDSVGNRVFEAVWQINSYTITYDIDGNNKVIVTGDYDSDVVQPQAPVRNGYKFLGWDVEIPEKMPAEDIVVTAKWEKLGYSGYGSRGGSSASSKGDDEKNKTDDDNKKTDKSDDSKSDDNGNTSSYKDLESTDKENSDSGKLDMDDLMNVYLWALDNGITTGETLEAALPDGYIKRGEMAKLVVDFVKDVLEREIPSDIPSQCSWGDDEKEWGSVDEKKYAEKACALGLMGIYMKNFKPNKLLDRAEFGTIVSRLLWGDRYNKPNATRINKFYTKHLEEVKKENLITKIDNPEAIKELRKWIWTVLKKIKK